MKEKLYTIPVNDGFNDDCECPLCSMYKTLEDNAVAYTLGPSYMESDVRQETDKVGFCKNHIQFLCEQGNTLGLSMILKTHIDKINSDVEKLSKQPIKSASFFKKSSEENQLGDYLDNVCNSCFICNRINNTFKRYIDTIFSLWKNDSSFREKFNKSKGFCMEHYSMLIKSSPNHLRGNDLNEFVQECSDLYLTNMKRLSDELEWFRDKHDYRYTDDTLYPWKNSKDSVQRAVIKTNGIIKTENKK